MSMEETDVGVVVATDGNCITRAGHDRTNSVRLARLLLAERSTWLVLSPAVGRIPLGGSVFTFLHYDCPHNRRVLQASGQMELVNTSSHWLVWSSGPPEAALPLRLDSDVIWARRQGGAVLLDALCRVHPSRPLSVRPAGHWSPATGIVLHRSALDNGWRLLDGLILGAAGVVVDTPPDRLGERLLVVQDRHLDTNIRFGWDLCQKLSFMFNFSVVLYKTESYGYLTPNGSIDGQAGMLYDGTIDLALSSLMLSHHRLDFIAFSAPSRMWTLKMVFRHPPSRAVYGTIFRPFTAPLWLSSGLLFSLVLVAARLSCWAAAHLPSDNSWSAAFLLVSSAISQQGTTLDTERPSWRMLVFLSFACALLLDTYYTAAIVTSLLLPPPRTINSKADLVHSELAVGMENISYTHEYFEKSSDPVDHALMAQKVWPRGAPEPNYHSLLEGVRKVATEAFAFTAEDVSLYPLLDRYVTEADKCSLVALDFMKSRSTYMPVRKNSPYRELVTIGLRKLLERGHISRTRSLWHAQPPACLRESEFATVELVTLAPAFMLLAAAVLLATLLLVLELRNAARNRKQSFLRRGRSGHRTEGLVVNTPQSQEVTASQWQPLPVSAAVPRTGPRVFAYYD
ncbi:ionotropic receptor 75a-like [Schistocerca piceifrons]|uniref:ionotropic receptor 75a-like n=1 Tax=Schistocerca piceifrons TaxID=274613 RepID=UPI001F5EB5BB|nr:ionotropic receptor 75a-like [Schistocerca piceifrons]